MMIFQEVVKKTEKLIVDNSPTIMTAVGVTGAIATAFLTGKATFKAAEIITREQVENPAFNDRRLTTMDKAKLTWQLYIPAAGVGALTIASIIFANRVGVRRAAAMAAAYSVSERAFSEYKDKVVEKLGKSKDRSVRDEVAQDRIDRNPVSKREVIITGSGDVLCYDDITGRYFESNIETLRKAQNDINESILQSMSGCATLGQFYDLIGLPPTKFSQEVGWNQDNLLELEFSTTLAEDGRPCISVGYAYFPSRDY